MPDNEPSLGRERLQGAVEGVLGVYVDALGRVVEKDDFRLSSESARNQRLLLVAAAKDTLNNN